MQVSKQWHILYAPYLIAISSLVIGIGIRDVIVNFWYLFYNNQPVISEPLIKDTELSENHINALLARAHTFIQNNHYEQAESFYHVIVTLQPTLVLAHLKLGFAQYKQNKYDAAIRTFTAVLTLEPDNVEALLRLSRIYCESKQCDKALDTAKKAAALYPNNVHAHLALGHICNKLGDTHTACLHYQNAIKLKPNFANAHYNLGYTLKLQRESEKALLHLLRAAELDNDHVDTHIALNELYWGRGDFKTAWYHYDWRWKQFSIDPKSADIPLWDGSPLHSKKILLYTEQGLGDTFQFIRYAKKIKEEYGCYILCKVQKPLETFLSSCPYIDEIVTSNPASSYYIATQAPLLNLVDIVKTTLTTIPHSIPYLYANKEATASWKAKLAQDTNIKVGLCWGASPEHEAKLSPLAMRSIELTLLAPLAHVPGVSFYSLQKVDGHEQVLYLPDYFKVHTFGPDFDSEPFRDTAAIIENLDLVISIDSAVAHLAGGLGKPVWLLLPYAAHCRWEHDEHTTPWYSSMRLFRQPAWKDFDSVIIRLKEALEEFVKQKKLSQTSP